MTQTRQTTPEHASTMALLAVAADAAITVVDRFDPATLDGPNPTSGWDTRTLTNHFIVWSAYALERRGLREPLGDDLTGHDFLTAADWKDEYVAHLRHGVQVWSQPGTFEGEVSTGDASMPARDIATMLLLETVLHGWDVAAADGQDYRSYVDAPGFGDGMLAIVRQWAPMYRQYDGFADEISVPDDAPAFDRALALAGRDPAWAPHV